MIPRIYQSTATEYESNGEGLLVDGFNWHVVEQDNGDFTCEFDYPVEGPLLQYLVRGNIIKTDASKRLKNQKFRIYKIEQDLDNMCVHVYARHKSFTLNYDFIPTTIDITTSQSCEYALNQIFANSLNHKHYKGYSDIVNGQTFKIGYVTPGEAIQGTQGSIIDTFGNGADIVRDNSTEDAIYVLNNRGKSNNVLIAYGKNLSGFNVIEDDSDMITRIVPYARYTPEGGSEIEYHPVAFDYVDAPNIDSYDIIYTAYLDFTDKLEQDQEPTDALLMAFCNNYYTQNTPNYPKLSYDIEFEELEIDDISATNLAALNDIGMCDTVLVWNSKFNVRTETKVIQTDYNPVTGKYNSLILGDPRASLDEVIGTGSVIKGEKGDKGDPGEPGADGDIGDFPDSLPSVPVISITSLFASLDISWTFESQPYYTYELYGSQVQGFTPSSINLLFEGKGSSYLHFAEPNQTWYFRCRAKNSQGRYTEFSTETSASTTKIADGTTWFETAAIGDALIGELRLDRGWVGVLKGNYIDAKNLTVTDGNGNRTLEIDDWGNVSLNVTELKIQSSNVATVDDISDTLIGTVTQYYVSTSSTQLTGGEWIETTPVWEDGKYVWQRMKYVAQDGTISYGNAVCIQGARGANGLNGKDGEDGTSVKILGSYNSLDELNAAHPSGNENGDGYMIDGILYVWDGTEFLNVGQIRGDDGVSMLWQGSFASHPSNPQNGWCYYNTTEGKSFTYLDGTWYQMTVDGTDGQDGTDGLAIVWKGELTTPPANPETNWVYKDTDNGYVYIYNGMAWELMVLDGSDGIDGADGSDGNSVFITYNDSATQPAVPTGDGTTNGWHTNATITAVWMSQKVAQSATEGTWGNPIKIKGEDGTSVKILGTYNSLSELNEAHPSGNENGDGYIVNGDLYVWDGSSFINVGQIKGTDGVNGVSAYVHIKYSNDGGTTFTGNNGEDPGEYLGVYADNTLADSTNPSDYTWSKVKGDTGEKGQSLVKSTPQWYLSTSSTTQTGGSWSETMPEVDVNKYLWLRYKLDWENPTATTYTTPTLEQMGEKVKETLERTSNLEQDLDGFKQTVSSTYAKQASLTDLSNNLASNYSTTTQMNTAIEQKANSITQSVSETYTTKTEFEGLTIGTRNYLAGTATTKSVTGTNTTNQCNTLYDITVPADLVGNQVTLSFNYTVSSYSKGTFRIQTNPTVWTAISNTITPSGNGTFAATAVTTLGSTSGFTNVQIRMDSFTGTVVISNMKLELGNKATSWTPAPEDVDGSISSLTTRMSTAENKLTADSLTTTIGNYYTTSTDVNGIIDSYDFATSSEVKQTADDLTATFNNGYYQGITQMSADGVKVFHSSIDSNSYTHMSPTGFYIKYKGTDIFQVDSNGLVVKGYATSSDLDGTNDWIQDLSDTYYAGYTQGVTAITNEGVKVYHNSINGENYTHMSPAGFYIKYQGNDIFWVDSSGLTMKGSITASSITGSTINGTEITSNGDNGDWTYINGGYIECGGTCDRWWLGNKETWQTIKLKSEYGKFRARNDSLDRSVYFSDQGLSTTADGDLGSSGILDFHNDWYGYGNKGIALYSNHHTSMIAYNGACNISPEWGNTGNNTFSFQVLNSDSASGTHGLIYYGSHVNGYSTCIQVSKDSNDPGINILDGNRGDNAYFQASHLWTSMLNNNYWTNGTLTMNQTWQGSQGGTQTYLSGTTVSATTFYQSGSTVSTSDIILKDNIQEYTGSALDIINKTKIYTFNRINTPNIDEIGFIAQQAPDELVYKRGEFTAEELEGLTIEEKTELLDKRTKELLEESGGEECELPISMMNQNNIIAIMFKAIQELKAQIDELKK